MDAEKKRLSLTEDERDEEEGDKHLSPPFHFSWEVGGYSMKIGYIREAAFP